MSEKKPQQLVKVTLATPHEHAGKQHQAGDKIDVTEPERKWLLDNKVINETAPAVQERK